MTDLFLSSTHNHNHCISDALDKASSICVKNNLRFTPIRQRVFEIIWASHAPVVAYDILSQLRKQKKNAEAPTVYRALEFLLENKLAHKIESLNAYIGCSHSESKHTSQFLICTLCRQVLEISNHNITLAIESHAKQLGFNISEQTIEISGVCASCQQ